MFRLTRSDTSRLWILATVLFSLVLCLPATSLATPKGGGSPPGASGDSGDPDDWGIDFCPTTPVISPQTVSDTVPDSQNAYWNEISQTAVENQSPLSKWYLFWIEVMARIRYLSR